MPPTKRAAKSRTAKKRGAKVVELPVEATAPQQQEGQYTVDPNRITQKLSQKVNDLNLELAMTQAAFEQSQDEVRQLRSTIDSLNARLAEYEGDDESEESDEEEAD